MRNMKLAHIYYVNDITFDIYEGYVRSNYKDYPASPVYFSDDKSSIFLMINLGYIYNNPEDAAKILKDLINKQINKLQRHIDDCTNKIELLTNKLEAL